MHRTRIKICGITRVEDALAAARHGADAIGLIFHDGSARNISESSARQIVEALPPFVAPVGVFVDAPADRIVHLAADVGVHVVQLNGKYEVGDLRALANASLRVIVALRAGEPGFAETVRGIDRSLACAIVLEPAGTGQPGGSGVSNDWDLVRRHQASGTFAKAPPLIAAGGLTSQNVGEVVRTVRPWAVDVSSGVEESTKGVKSDHKIREFIFAVRSVDNTRHSDPFSDNGTR